VLVLGRVHVVAELVGGLPELGLEAEVGAGVGGALLRARLLGALRRRALGRVARARRELGRILGDRRRRATEDPGDDRLLLLAPVVEAVRATDLLELVAP
jgi:hypothetical protein